jgi:photosystem I P700 chlorophyll a apoprotein A2
VPHGAWDPHFCIYLRDALSGTGEEFGYAVVLAYSGLFNVLDTLRLGTAQQSLILAQWFELLSVFSMVMSRIHSGTCAGYQRRLSKLGRGTYPSRAYIQSVICAGYDLSGFRLNFHTGPLVGVSSVLWAGYLMSVESQQDITSQNKQSFWQVPTTPTKGWGGLQQLLTFDGGLENDTCSLLLSDITHHHLAIGILALLQGHLYSSVVAGLGVGAVAVSWQHGNSGFTSVALLNGTELQLSLASAGLGVLTSLVSQHSYSLTPYSYLACDYVSYGSLFIHHEYLASGLMLASFVHGSIFLIKEYASSRQQDSVQALRRPSLSQGWHSCYDQLETASQQRHAHSVVTTQLSRSGQTSQYQQDPFARLLSNKPSLLSHLSWVCLLVGFRTTGLFIHNDSVVGFGEPEKQLLFEPVYGSLLQEASELILTLTCGDWYSHKSIALGLHLHSF